MLRPAWAVASIAYRDGLVGDDPLNLGYKEKGSFKVGNEYLEAFANETHLIIGFRGSDEFMDWPENLVLDFEDRDVYNVVWAIVELFPRHKKVYTGHSRGGGFAQNCGKKFVKKYQESCSVITFACPPFLSKRERDEYNLLPIDHTNVISKGDIVATNSILYGLGKRHPGKTIYLDKSWWARFKFWGHTKHSRESYWEKIKKRWPI